MIYGIVFFGVEEKWHFKNIINRFQQLGKGVYIPLLFFVIGMVGYFSAPHFQYLLGTRVPDAEGNRILVALALFPEFFPVWIKNVFLIKGAIFFVLAGILSIGVIVWHHISYTISNGSLILSVIHKEYLLKSIRVIVLAISLVIGVAFFNGTLLISGKSMYGKDVFWVTHTDLRVLTRMMIFSALLTLIGYIFTLLSLQREKILKIVIFVLVSLLAFSLRDIYINQYHDNFTQRVNWYQTEKIYRFYALQGKTAILPANTVREDGSYWHSQLGVSSKETPIDWTGRGYIAKNYPMVYYKDIDISLRPRPTNYVSYLLTNSNIALQLFTEAGGKITEEELQNPVFDRLFDENFVLNKK